MGKVFIVAPGLAIRGLIFLPEMPAAGFFAGQSVPAQKFGEFEEIPHPACVFQRLIQFFLTAWHHHLAPELFAQFGDARQGRFQPGRRARHPAIFPQQLAQLAMERSRGSPALAAEQTVGSLHDLRLGRAEFRLVR